MKYQKWNILPPQTEASQTLRRAGYPALLSDVLAARGIANPAQAAALLEREASPQKRGREAAGQKAGAAGQDGPAAPAVPCRKGVGAGGCHRPCLPPKAHCPLGPGVKPQRVRRSFEAPGPFCRRRRYFSSFLRSRQSGRYCSSNA